MAKTKDHNAIIKEIARDALGANGFVQIGRSRTWLEDRSWYYVWVEFQPSMGGNGTYLNVYADWFWYPSDSISGAIGGRFGHFAQFYNEESFRKKMAVLIEIALTQTAELHRDLETLERAYRRVKGKNRPVHFRLDQAILCGLTGRAKLAHGHLDAVLADGVDRDFEKQRASYIEALRPHLDNRADCAAYVEAQIQTGRRLLKFPERVPNLLAPRGCSFGLDVLLPWPRRKFD